MQFLKNTHHDNKYLLSSPGSGAYALLQRVFVRVLFSLLLMIGLTTQAPIAQAETIITNTATASFSINGTPHSLSDSIQFSKDTEVTPADVITLQKQADTASADVGDLISYTLTLNNPNTHALNNVSIQDTLPAGLVYEAATANSSDINSIQVSSTDNQLLMLLGDMPAGKTWSVRYQLKVTTGAAAGVALNQAIVNSDTASSNTAQATVSISVAAPVEALQLSKQSSKSSAKIGEVVRYTLKIKNNNPYEIANIKVNDTLPAGLEFKPGSAVLSHNGNSTDILANTTNGLVFVLGHIPATSEWTLNYDATIKSSINSRTLINQAQVIADDSDANSNSAKASIEIISDDILVSKQADKQSVNINDVVTYTVTISNPAQHDLAHLVVQDLLPGGFIYQTGSAKIDAQALAEDSVLVNGRSLQVSLGTLAQGKSLTLSYQASVTEHAVSGDAVNQVQAESDYALSDLATATVRVRTPSTIEFLKIDDAGVDSLIPPTAYNDNQNGGRHWQEIDTITLPDGSTASLPTPQPLIDAKEYSASEPIVIQVKDLDQNTDPDKLDTIIVTIQIPGTRDKEVLLLTETSPDSGIFRGVILTTTETTAVQNGLLTLKQGVKINVSYRDEEDNTDISATAALVIPETQLALNKTADKSVAAVGELVRYTLSFDNTARFTLPTVDIQDTLPLGLRYVTGSATLNGSPLASSKVNKNGRSLTFKLSNMPSGNHWTLEYVTKITAGVEIGKAVNRAQITSGQTKSNIARATIYIEDELMRTRNILTGRVYIGCPDQSDKDKKDVNVLKDARIYLETGRSVLTDGEGFWHMEGVQPGTHVLQLDRDSLPGAYKPILCRDNTRHAGDAKSRFVDLQPGSLWQVDFNVQAEADPHQDPANTEVKKPEKIDPKKRYGDQYLRSAPEGFEILWPKNNYVPAVASTKIIVKSSPQQRVDVFLNGKQVNPLNYDGSDTNKARTVTIRRWLGVDIDIKERNNTLLVILKDKSGKEIARKTQNIHFSGNPASAELLLDQSVLIADGKTTPVIALRVKDEDGFPMRANTHGYFSLENSNYRVKILNQDEDTLKLNESLAGSYKYLIEEDGIARIELNPTTQSGEVKLKLQFAKNKTTTNNSGNVSVWLKPHLRKWILVGIAEGTLGYNTLSGNLQTLKDLDKSDRFFKRGRLAFFAKGQVKGKYLLTLAYDTHKQKQDVGTQLDGNIDPDAWYTVYADNSSSQYDAPSSRKLYVKIEKDNFYALFGDYHTGMSVTELANYERVLNGIKTEYQSERYSVNAFVSETSNQHQHREIPGDGTSGLYYLSRDIVPNSETVKIETRDRFHSERILETRELVRYQDYDIDYDAGTLFFKFPVTGRDRDFNPNIIVADYDIEDDARDDSNKAFTVGGRVAARTHNKRLEVGLSVLNEGRNKGRDNRLIGTDVTYHITPDTKIHAEAAQSQTAESRFKSKHAYMLELEKEIETMEARLYFKKEDGNYGIDSQASEDATRKGGAELRYRLNDKTQLNSEISYQKNLSNKNERQLAEVGIEHRYKQVEVSAGVRHTREVLTDESFNNNTILLGAQYTTEDGKVTLRSDLEKNLSARHGSELSPDRAIVGVDVKLNHGFSVFAEHETTDDGDTTTHNSRVGVSKPLWEGAKAKTAYTQERTDQGQRNYATLGLSQNIKITDSISADISVDQAKTISDKQAPKRFNEDEPAIQGTQRDDYTAFSVGLGSDEKDWSWTTRFELRNGEINDKINFSAGLIRHLEDGKNLSAKITHYHSENKSAANEGAEDDFENYTRLSLGTAWHPKNRNFVFLNRLDLVDEDNSHGTTNNLDNNFFSNTASGLENHTQKIIHNVHYNRKINKKTQFSIHHGIKYVKEASNDVTLSTTVDTASVEVRRDINQKWDIGIHGGYLHDWNEATVEGLVGVSVGVTPAKNTWLGLGYNFEGFYDKDFDKSDYKRKGPYVNFRYKFNQDSFAGDLPIRKKPRDDQNDNVQVKTEKSSIQKNPTNDSLQVTLLNNEKIHGKLLNSKQKSLQEAWQSEINETQMGEMESNKKPVSEELEEGLEE